MAETLVTALGRIFGPAVTKALAPDQLASSATSVVETLAPPDVEPDLELVETPEGVITAPPVSTTLRELATEAQQHLEAAEAAQRAGDWATYGEELKKLEDVIVRMQNAEP